eukprot:GEZU01042303.1.p1 GENE.GEZU01042303.1~~GEZU01042303.1.p1  ORF type:complete len:1246 (-),score=572.27 GEZU01042303.1:103-3840(-)
MSASTTFSVAGTLKKAESSDKDIRHMALYDFHTELQKDNFRLDETSQRQLADMVLKLLGDNSSDVQGMAVKCMAPLVKKMSTQQIESSIDMLCDAILKGEGDKRDIATIAMKTVIAEIPVEIAATSMKKAINPLIKGIKDGSNEVKMECIDVLNDLIVRFGTLVPEHHAAIQGVLIDQLLSKRQPIRKRAISCLAALSVYTNDQLSSKFITTVINGIENTQGEDLRTYIQTASAVSRTAGHRLGPYLDKIIPLLTKNADALETEEVIEGEGEVRENIMQAFECFVLRCPEEVSPYIDEILAYCKAYLEYDPNYEYDESEEEDEDEDMAGADDEDEDEEAYSDGDDEDISWKVRKAAAKCLSAIITNRPDLLDSLFQELCSPDDYSLIRCFKEREESVKLDIFQTFIDLLNQTAIQVSSTQNLEGSGLPVVRQRAEVKYLRQTKGIIVKRLRKLLKQKSTSLKVRVGIFRVLKELVIVLQGELKDYVSFFVPGIAAALADNKSTNSTLKIEALTFLRLFLASHPPEAFKNHVAQLSKAVYNAVNDKYYKIVAEALRVCGQLVRVVVTLKGSADYVNQVNALFNAVHARLETQDIDQDVKESAITTTGLILANLGDSLDPKSVRGVLDTLLDRLKNEVTRNTTTRTFATIAQAPNNVDLKPVLNDLVNELAKNVRKNNRVLRQSTLTALDAIVKSYGKSMDAKLYQAIITEVAELISDSDLQLCTLALNLCSSIMSEFPSSASIIEKVVLPKILALLQSPTLQGQALDALLNLLAALAPSVGFSKLLDAVISTVGDKGATTKQVYASVAKSVATLCTIAPAKDRDARVVKFIKDLSSGTDANKILALFCLGEIGLRVNLSTHGNLQKEIEACFESGSEEIKSAASFALGNVSVGNLGSYLPFILNEIRTNPKRKYLLLHSLKEIIIRSDAEAMKPFIADVLPLLFEYAENEEEGVRNVVAECLGKTALVDPAVVLPKLKEALEAGAASSEFKRSTVITAMKYTITEKPQPIDMQLKADIGQFTKHLTKEEPVSVRRAAVLLFTAAAHNKPSLITPILNKFLPHLYAESETDRSLIREVNLGPFKHKVDDGLELRKATFECMDTLLDQCLEFLDPLEFIKNLKNGLSDDNQDIRMLTNLMISKLAVSAFASVLASLDAILEPTKATLTKKLKDTAVQQERERHEDLLRSSLRAIHAISRIKGIDQQPKFQELIKSIDADPKLKHMLKTISAEDSTAAGETAGVAPMEM